MAAKRSAEVGLREMAIWNCAANGEPHMKADARFRRLLRAVKAECAERGKVAGRETCSCCGGRRVHEAGEPAIRAAILRRP